MFKDTKEGTTHFFGDGCKPPHRCPKGTCKRSVYGVCKVCNVGMPPTKTPSPSGEKHGPHAARFVKGLEKSAQDVFESVTQEKTALMVNMSAPTSTSGEGVNPTVKHDMKCPRLYGEDCNCNPTPTSPVDDAQKRMDDTKRILKMAAPGLARPNEPVEEGCVDKKARMD